MGILEILELLEILEVLGEILEFIKPSAICGRNTQQQRQDANTGWPRGHEMCIEPAHACISCVLPSFFR